VTEEGSASARLTVAVLTYRRLDDLAAVLPMLVEQAVRASESTRMPIGVLVVDNDPDAGARTTVTAYPDQPVRYVHEPSPGIAAARNRAIEESADSEVLIFIDDDERPVAGWLQALLDTYRATGADGVVGPVASRFTGTLDPWIEAGGFFTRRRLPTGTEVRVAATNNLLLNLHSVRRRGLRFDQRLGLIGGEDTLFTRQLTGTGGRIVWCAEALVHDIVPADRMTRAWVLRRAFRMGGTASRVEVRLAGSFRARTLARLRQLLLGGSRLGVGGLRFGLGLLTTAPGRRAAGARNCARGLGLICGAFGIEYREYHRP
jgi:succinoglycan biosynthesis protein ExoM